MVLHGWVATVVIHVVLLLVPVMVLVLATGGCVACTPRRLVSFGRHGCILSSNFARSNVKIVTDRFHFSKIWLTFRLWLW